MPVPHHHGDLRTAANGDDPGLPDLRHVLDRTAWQLQAACKDEETNTFFPDETFGNPRLHSASLLIPLLVCSECPVRRPCLEESLTPWRYSHEEGALLRRDEYGVFGGTLGSERHQAAHLSIDEAVEMLENTLAERIDKRVREWWRMENPRRTRRDKRIAAILASRSEPVKRFHLGGLGGPGRGHRGPVAELAASLGVSRSTAGRRLKAS